MKTLIIFLLIVSPLVCNAQQSRDTSRSFNTSVAGEVLATISASSPGASWSTEGAEASVATVYVDDRINQHLMLFQGSREFNYEVFLGRLDAGKHEIRIQRHDLWSAKSAGLNIRNVQTQLVSETDPRFIALRFAPIIQARADTIGRFSDVPLLMYCERTARGTATELQYTVIFTNEDAGTPSDALMARWGRSTDIEYIYKVTLDKAGTVTDEVFQAFEHKEQKFRGRKEGDHPVILVSTLNNVFSDSGFTALHYRLAPVLVDLGSHSREFVMDANPWIYRISAEEMLREGKLRPFGERAFNKLGDARNYLIAEMNLEVANTGIAVWAKLKDQQKWYSSHQGRLDFTVSRNGWSRTTIELPPGTAPGQIEAIAFECIDLRDPRTVSSGSSSKCEIKDAPRFFRLDEKFTVVPINVTSPSTFPIAILNGEMETLRP
jgi:hypothetical protein